MALKTKKSEAAPVRPPCLQSLQKALKECLIYISARPDLDEKLRKKMDDTIELLSNPLEGKACEKAEKRIRELLFKLEVFDQDNGPGREALLLRMIKNLVQIISDHHEGETNPYYDELNKLCERLENGADIRQLKELQSTIIDTAVKSSQFEREAKEKLDEQIYHLVTTVLQLLRDPDNEFTELNGQIDQIIASLQPEQDFYKLLHINRKLKYLLEDYPSLIALARRERKELLDIIGTLVETMKAYQSGNQAFEVEITHFLEELKRARNLNSIHRLRETLIQETRQMMERTKSAKSDSQKLQQQLLKSQTRILVLEDELHAMRQKLAEALKARDQDHLTQLPNRRLFDQQLNLAMETFHRHKIPHCLALLDIDHFKQINDRYGHQAGDFVLARVARIIRSGLRKIDFLARIGGEEFASIMPNTTARGGFAVMERIREQVAGTPFIYENQRIEVTVSIGLAEMEIEYTRDTWFKQADMALYRAKEKGRNRTEVALLTH